MHYQHGIEEVSEPDPTSFGSEAKGCPVSVKGPAPPGTTQLGARLVGTEEKPLGHLAWVPDM
jgi:hypothetical protein